MINYFNKIKDFLIWMATMAIIVFALCGLHQCDLNTSKVPQNGNKVDTVLVVRHDTINKIKLELKIKTIYIDTGRIEYIHADLDKVVPPIGNENVCIAENQLRQCMKCQDSLEAYKQIVAVDSQTIDTLSKLAKKVDTIKIAPSILDRAKDFGAGFLVGAGIKLLF